MQRRASAITLLLAFGLIVGGRGAEANHTTTSSCSVSPATATQGGRITVSGTTGAPDEDITIRIDSSTTPLGTDKTDDGEDAGHFSKQFTVPSTTPTGTRTIRIDRPAGTEPTCTFTVTAATPTPTPSPTPTATATPRPTATPTDEPRPTRAPASRQGEPRLNVLGDDKFKPGELVKVTGARMTPNENYNLDFAQSPGTIVARGTSNRLGSVRFEFRIPSTARTGSATLTALPADGSGRTASATITIESGSATSGSADDRSLPATGRNVAVYTTLAVLLLLGGLSMQRYEWLRKTPDRRANSVLTPPKRFWG